MPPWLQLRRTPQGPWVACDVCRVAGVLPQAQAQAFLAQHSAHQSPAKAHYGLGDAVAAATKRLGVEPCTPCEARRQAMNQLVPRLWRR